MKITTEATLLHADNVRQMEWIEANYRNWSSELVYRGLITSSADDLVDAYVHGWGDNLTIGVQKSLIRKLGKSRVDQLETDDGKSLSTDEKKLVKEAIIKEKLAGGDDHDFERVGTLEISYSGKVLMGIFMGFVEGNAIEFDLYRIYGSASAAEVVLNGLDDYVEEFD